MKNSMLMMLICALLSGCGNLERDNPLDPKNPNAMVPQAILVELFVNDSTGYDYCNYAIDALERLAQRAEFLDMLFIAEYHLVNRNQPWNDLYAKNDFNQRYYEYVPNISERGIPDAMFNGLMQRVQGASLENIDARYAAAATALLGKSSQFGIEANKKISNNRLELELTIGFYGHANESNVELNTIVCEDLELPRHHHVVRMQFQKQTLLDIKPGEIRSFSLGEPLPLVDNVAKLSVLVFLQKGQSHTKEILQVVRF